MLRQACETLVAECDERRAGWTEQGPGRAKEEVLTEGNSKPQGEKQRVSVTLKNVIFTLRYSIRYIS